MTARHGNPKGRTRRDALSAIRFVRALPAGDLPRDIGNQLLRSGTSVGADYRAGRRARSRADMVARFKLVEEGLDQRMDWPELFEESGYEAVALRPDLDESEQLVSIKFASIEPLRSRNSLPAEREASENSSLVTHH